MHFKHAAAPLVIYFLSGISCQVIRVVYYVSFIAGRIFRAVYYVQVYPLPLIACPVVRVSCDVFDQ